MTLFGGLSRDPSETSPETLLWTFRAGAAFDSCGGSAGSLLFSKVYNLRLHCYCASRGLRVPNSTIWVGITCACSRGSTSHSKAMGQRIHPHGARLFHQGCLCWRHSKPLIETEFFNCPNPLRAQKSEIRNPRKCILNFENCRFGPPGKMPPNVN